MEDINLNDLLEPLFKEAKDVDEFEFCCCILRMRGSEGPGWDPLQESAKFISQIASLIDAPIDNELKIRLSLLLYCHATEIDDVYLTIANLFRIIKGDRYGSAIFKKKDEEGKKIKYPSQKISEIKKLAQDSKYENIPEVMEYFLEKEIRNAFYHSDYILYEDAFNIRNGAGVLMNGIIDPSVPLAWFMPKVRLGVEFSIEVINLIQKSIHSYRKEKVVNARILQNEEIDPVLSTVNPKFGLSGFRSLTEEEKASMKKK
ncbi:MAG: hypothetical protein WCJ25_00290 [Candidatus Moraniibacteriota bacterium]